MQNMKAYLTLIAILIFGASALAQNKESHDKIQPIEMGIVLDAGVIRVVSDQKMETAKENKIAQLYRYKNSRVKKALAFSTKQNRAKLA
jgi:hypothetical protein